jgi:hypothetical protein
MSSSIDTMIAEAGIRNQEHYDIITRVLNDTTRALSFREFIEIGECKIQAVDRFFHGLSNGLPILVDDDVLRWLGYNMDGKQSTVRTYRTEFKNLLKKLDGDHTSYIYVSGTKLLNSVLKYAIQNIQVGAAETRERNGVIVPGDYTTMPDLTQIQKSTIDSVWSSVRKGASFTAEDWRGAYPVQTIRGKRDDRKYGIVTPKLLKLAAASLPSTRGAKIKKAIIDYNDIHVAYATYLSIAHKLKIKELRITLACSQAKYANGAFLHKHSTNRNGCAKWFWQFICCMPKQ